MPTRTPHSYTTLAGAAGGHDGSPVPYRTARIETSLFDLREDPGKTRDVAADHPQVVERLQRLADEARLELGDKRTGDKGKGVRAPDRVEAGGR